MIHHPEQQKKGKNRDTIDKFYTHPRVADICITHVKTHIQISKTDDLIIEPSSGNGSFIEGIKKICDNCLFYDIEPDHIEIIRQDYLEFELSNVESNINRKIHVIGNPPFGRQSSLAIKFIKKSASFCDTISFILPKSFKKESLRKSFPLEFHIVFETDLPDMSFLVNGSEHDVPSIFQIWEKRKGIGRQIVEKMEPQGFEFVKKTDNPHISFRRVGVNAGKAEGPTTISEKSEQSHYFLKFGNGKTVEENLVAIKNILFDFNNTVGPKSISKQELIKKLNPNLHWYK
jgi:predicted RNA methylase